MSTNLHRETAKIYTFPVKADVVRRRINGQMMAEIADQRLPRTDYGSGWYHETAIEDAAKEQNH